MNRRAFLFRALASLSAGGAIVARTAQAATPPFSDATMGSVPFADNTMYFGRMEESQAAYLAAFIFLNGEKGNTRIPYFDNVPQSDGLYCLVYSVRRKGDTSFRVQVRVEDWRKFNDLVEREYRRLRSVE